MKTSKIWRRWQAWVLRQERATTLALFRILVSTIVLGSLLSAAAAGVIDVTWVDAAHGGMLSLGSGNWLVSLLGGPTPAVVWGLFGVGVAGGSFTLIGLGGRWPVLATLQAYLGLTSLNPTASGGFDNLLTIALWLLFLSGSNATLSVDARRQEGTWLSQRSVAAWPRHVLILQLVVMYTATGLQKVSLSWTPMGGYTALYYVLHDPTWLRSEQLARSVPLPLLRLGTAVTWHWEQLTCLLLLVFYFRATRERPGRLRAAFNRWDLRLPWACIGLSLHLGILMLIDVGPFSFVSLAYYVNLFTPEEIEAQLLGRLSAIWRAWRNRRTAGSRSSPIATS